MRILATLLAAIGLSTAGLPVAAQAPDCTGISTVFNTSSDLTGELDAVLVASGLLRPLQVVAAPGDSSRLFIVEQDGLIKIVKDGVLLPDPFLDLDTLVRSPEDCANPNQCNEQGLLGLAFHPDYTNNGWFFVFHTNLGSLEVLARYTVDAGDPDRGDPTTRADVLTVPSAFSNHNGGMVAFSPIDGRLYLGTGDGGGSCDTFGNGQDTSSLNGKLLRLNVDSLPATTTGNPFDGVTPGADEVWAYGLRNPYRFSFDRITGALYIGDVGQFLVEEVDCQPPTSSGGENYGWDRFEGSQCPNPSCGSQGSCVIPDHVLPLREYGHTGGACSITGGHVYRGCRMPDLRGTYFYGDFCAPFVRTFPTDAACSVTALPDLERHSSNGTGDLAPASPLAIDAIASFGEDARGELYIVDRGGINPAIGAIGEVFRVVPSLRILEVSGRGADGFDLQDGDDWTWEDLGATTGHPISEYRVYRATAAAGPFSCKKRVLTPAWPGGDPAVPAPGTAFFYLVTAKTGGNETVPGAQSDGTLRSVNTVGLCI